MTIPSVGMTLFTRLLAVIAWWFVFRDIIHAPNWGAWAVSVAIYYVMMGNDYSRSILALKIATLKRRRS